MTIHFYLNNEEETKIMSFYDMHSNPFKIGDVLKLSVEELYPVEYNKFRESYREILFKDNNELQIKFNRKDVKIVREGKYVRIKVGNESKLTIEYHCEFVED